MAMTPTRIEALLTEPRNIVVAAIRRDGRPQMTPTWFHWDGSRFFVSTTKTTAKYRNLRRDPRVQLLIDDPQGYRTVILDGEAEIWEDHRRCLPYMRFIRGKHGLPPEEDEAMLERLAREGRVLLVITPSTPPEQWLSWGG